MPLVDREIADWEGRERSIEGLAEFFNNYQVPFLGFGNSDKNKQLYLKQMAEISEFVSACLKDLIYEKKEEKKKITNDILAMKVIEIELIKKNLVTEKKIKKVKDNLLHIYKEPSFESLERAEMMAYGANKEIKKVIVLLNHDKFDDVTSYDEGDFAELKE